MSEKTEKPTPKRLKEAREKGQVIKSAEITTGIQLAVVLVYLMIKAPEIFEAFEMLIKVVISSINMPIIDALQQAMRVIGSIVMRLLFPLFIVIVISTIFSVICQIGLMASVKALAPKAEKLNPISNAKQIVSIKSILDFLKSAAKISIITGVFYFLLKSHLKDYQYLSICGIPCAISVTGKFVGWMWGILLLFYILFGIFDYSMERRRLMKQLRMSRDEIKQEHKNTEGSPEIKGKRREMHREIQSGSFANSVRKSSVVVRNPSHICVCLQYVPGETPLPQITQMVTDHRVKALLEIAEKFDIPMIEHVHVARTLYKKCEIGDFIPPELFVPVAEILRLVEEHRAVANGPSAICKSAND